MSRRNVEIVRRTLAAFDARDMEAGDESLDPSFVIDASRNIFNPNVYTGLDGVREWMAETEEVWQEMRLLPMEFIDAGDQVVVISRLVGKGKASGLEIDRVSAQVATLRDGLITRWEIGYTDPDDAKEVAGLSK